MLNISVLMEVILVPDLTVQDVANELAVNPETVKRMLQSGRLAGYKVGRLWRMTREAVDQFKSSTVNVKTDDDMTLAERGR